MKLWDCLRQYENGWHLLQHVVERYRNSQREYHRERHRYYFKVVLADNVRHHFPTTLLEYG